MLIHGQQFPNGPLWGSSYPRALSRPARLKPSRAGGLLRSWPVALASAATVALLAALRKRAQRDRRSARWHLLGRRGQAATKRNLHAPHPAAFSRLKVRRHRPRWSRRDQQGLVTT